MANIRTAPNSHSTRGGMRFTHVDLLRGVCALCVVITHYGLHLAPGTGPGGGLQPLASVLDPIYRFGGWAVQMFWILSGFVFFMAYGTQGRTVPVYRFAAWRFARLYPLHFLTLLLMAGLQLYSLRKFGIYQIYQQNDVWHFVQQLFLASAWSATSDNVWLASTASFNAPIWSVSVEVIIYGVFLAYLKLARPGLITALVVIVGAAGLYAATHLMVLQCAIYFFVGLACASVLVLLRDGLPRRNILLAGGAFAGAICLSCFVGHSSVREHIIKILVFPSILLLLATLDIYRPPLPAFINWIGDSTYAVYLLHMPIMVFVTILIRSDIIAIKLFYSPSALIGFVAVTLGCSYMVYRSFELPAQRWLRRTLVPDRREPLEPETSRTI